MKIIYIGQKLWSKNGEEVTIYGVLGDTLHIYYKGERYERPVEVIGTKLFFENPKKKSESTDQNTHQLNSSVVDKVNSVSFAINLDNKQRIRGESASNGSSSSLSQQRESTDSKTYLQKRRKKGKYKPVNSAASTKKGQKTRSESKNRVQYNRTHEPKSHNWNTKREKPDDKQKLERENKEEFLKNNRGKEYKKNSHKPKKNSVNPYNPDWPTEGDATRYRRNSKKKQ